MKTDQQGTSNKQGNQSQQGTNQNASRSQSDLDSIIRQGQGKFSSQSVANSYLQPHGLSCQIRDDGTAEIFEGVNAANKLATVRFQGSKDQQSIGSIDY